MFVNAYSNATLRYIRHLGMQYYNTYDSLRGDMKNWFEIDVDSPSRLMVADVAQKHRRAVSNHRA